jgi:hypothetical protein
VAPVSLGTPLAPGLPGRGLSTKFYHVCHLSGSSAGRTTARQVGIGEDRGRRKSASRRGGVHRYTRADANRAASGLPSRPMRRHHQQAAGDMVPATLSLMPLTLAATPSNWGSM